LIQNIAVVNIDLYDMQYIIADTLVLVHLFIYFLYSMTTIFLINAEIDVNVKDLVSSGNRNSSNRICLHLYDNIVLRTFNSIAIDFRVEAIENSS